jgi:misacylated tRNA(Ala) deacylase
MTEKLYLANAYCFENDATIVDVIGNGVVIDRSCIYPGGGGQLPDSAQILFDDGHSEPVIEIRKTEMDEFVYVFTTHIAAATVGTKCIVKIDRDKRLGYMRSHTALHVFNTVMQRMFGAWITGAKVGYPCSHIDFVFESDYSSAMKESGEEETNVILSQNLLVISYYIDEDNFINRPELLRCRDVLPPIVNGQVRVVEIGSFEAQACGGTHVRNTKEVGHFRINKVDNKGKNNRRFYTEII